MPSESKSKIFIGYNATGKGIPFVFVTANDFGNATPVITEHFILIVNPIAGDQEPELLGQITEINNYHNYHNLPINKTFLEDLLNDEILIAKAHLKNHLYASFGERALSYETDLTEYEGFILKKLCAINKNFKNKIQKIAEQSSCNDLKNKLNKLFVFPLRIEITKI